MKCVTVTLNASIDTTYVMERLYQGGVNRVQQKLAVPGGKGNNVARVLKALGHSVITTGFVGGRSGQYIEEALREDGIETAFVRVLGESRVSLGIVEQATGDVTEIREQGCEVSREDGERFLESLKRLAAGADVVVFSGSLPPGLSHDFYAWAIQHLSESSPYVVLDSSGPAFQRGLSQHLDLIKPNASEMAALMEQETGDEEMAEYAQGLIGTVLKADAMVLLSLGNRGAVLATSDAKIFAHAPRVDARSSVGSGDAMIAGFLDARFAGMDNEAALRNAVATGSAAATQLTPGTIDPATIPELAESVKVWQ
jgi:1-phosphofructokinase family hexose kinase